MATPAHKDNKKHFSELTSQEQAESISAQILNVEAGMKHRLNAIPASDRQRVKNGLLKQIDGLHSRVSKL
jgi:hypothetical protein